MNGMIIKPDHTLKFDCFVDREFAGLQNYEDQKEKLHRFCHHSRWHTSSMD